MVPYTLVKFELFLSQGVDEWSDEFEETPNYPRNCYVELVQELIFRHSESYFLPLMINARPIRSG